MQPYQISVNSFMHSVALGHRVDVSVRGIWRYEGKFLRFIRWLCHCLENQRIISVTNLYMRSVDLFEKNPVAFETQGNLSKEFSEKFSTFAMFKAGQVLQSQLSSIKSAYGRRKLVQLQRRLIAIQYRLEFSNPLAFANPAVNSELIRRAQIWKQNQLLADPNKTLTPVQVQHIAEICRYPELAQLVLIDGEQFELLMRWIIRCNLDPHTYVQYPHMATKLRESFLTGRIGYYDGNMMRMHGANSVQRQAQGLREKDLQLLFEGRTGAPEWHTILNDNESVTFRLGFTCTIREVFKQFAKKDVSWSELEMTAEGITNWNAALLGRWDGSKHALVDLNVPSWYEQVPVTRYYTAKEARDAFGSMADGKNWIEGAIATRKFAGPKLPGAHAFTAVGTPLSDSRYAFRYFSKATTEEDLPKNMFEKVTAVGGSLKGAIIWELAVFEPRRQFGAAYNSISPAQGFIKYDIIKKYAELGRKGLLRYQVMTYNCAHFTSETMINGPKNLFYAPFAACEPPGPITHLHRWAQTKSASFQSIFYRLFFKIVGGNRAQQELVHGRVLHGSILDDAPWLWTNNPNSNQVFRIPSLDQRLFDSGDQFRLFNPTYEITG